MKNCPMMLSRFIARVEATLVFIRLLITSVRLRFWIMT